MNGDIVDVKVRMIGIDLPHPFPLAFGTLFTLPRVFLILTVSNYDETFKSIGEASIDFPFSHYDAWDVFHSLESLDLKGKNVNDRSKILQSGDSRAILRHPAAFAALNMALDDAYGKLNNVSVPSLYGIVRSTGKALESISMPNDVAELQREFTRVVSKGHVLKLKGGRGINVDAEFISTVLSVDPTCKFAVDFNAAYSIDQFSQLVKILSKHRINGNRILFFEQPTTTVEGINGLIQAAKILKHYGVSTFVMADESFVTVEDAVNCQSAGILLNFKIQKIGGIMIAKEIENRLGNKAHASMVGGTFPTAIGRTWDQHALCTLRMAQLPSDGWEPSTDWFDGDLHLIKERFMANAFIGSGLGVTVRWDLLQKYEIVNPRAEYMRIRNNQSGERIRIMLKDGFKYADLYEKLNNKPHNWNL